MFAGHLAVGLVGKRIEPRISLGTWTLAALAADLLFFVFLLGGIEHIGIASGVTVNRFVGDIPYSHSLLMDAIWGGLFAAAYWMRARHPRGAWLLFGAVVSHWVLDFISHRPDMQLAPGTHAVFGLELWNSIPATLVLEGGAWLLALVLYSSATRARTRVGIYAFWSGAALLTLAFYGNITGGIDPNPVRAGTSGLIFFSLTVAWAYWMNRARPISERPR
jgi:hypothetical protein